MVNNPFQPKQIFLALAAQYPDYKIDESWYGCPVKINGKDYTVVKLDGNARGHDWVVVAHASGKTKRMTVEQLNDAWAAEAAAAPSAEIGATITYRATGKAAKQEGNFGQVVKGLVWGYSDELGEDGQYSLIVAPAHRKAKRNEWNGYLTKVDQSKALTINGK